jgi:hypothetical protein
VLDFNGKDIALFGEFSNMGFGSEWTIWVGGVDGCEKSLLGRGMSARVEDVEWDTEECSGMSEHSAELATAWGSASVQIRVYVLELTQDTNSLSL